MIVIFIIAVFLFYRKSEDANYSTLIWLPPYISKNYASVKILVDSKMFHSSKKIGIILLLLNCNLKVEQETKFTFLEFVCAPSSFPPSVQPFPEPLFQHPKDRYYRYTGVNRYRGKKCFD